MTDTSNSIIPHDVICLIRDHLVHASQFRTLSSLLQASRATYDLVAPHLYRRLVLTRSNASNVLVGLATPPDRSIRRARPPASAPPDIHWRRFLSREFYIEWAGLFEAAPNEGLRSRRQYLIWPDGDAESGGEESGSESGQDGEGGMQRVSRQIQGLQLEWPHPTYASHKRKQALLGHLRHLTIASLPSMRVCSWLDMLIRGGDKVFDLLDHLVLDPKALWSLIDWEDRHPRSVHPFRSVLAQMAPRHLCITYPAVDQHFEKSFMVPRIVTNEEHLSRQSQVDQYTFLRFKLQRLLSDRYSKFIESLASSWLNKADSWPIFRSGAPVRLREVTVHNLTCEDVPHLPGVQVRIFAHPCSCNDDEMLDKVVDTSCYTHWEESRLRHIVYSVYRAMELNGTPEEDILVSRTSDTPVAGTSTSDTPGLPSGSQQPFMPEDHAQVEWIDGNWQGASCLPLRRSARCVLIPRPQLYMSVPGSSAQADASEDYLADCIASAVSNPDENEREAGEAGVLGSLAVPDDGPAADAARGRIREKVRAAVSQVAAFRSSETASPCRCCDRGQLTYRATSIGYQR